MGKNILKELGIYRTTVPEKGNKFYNTIGNGGWSTAIKGSPTNVNADVLSNCVGWAFGYLNEIAYKILGSDGVKKLFKENGGKLVNLNSNKNMPLLQPLNAENFYDVAIQQGLEVTQTPRVGDVICWQKGDTRKSSDGAGHVAVVIDVLSSDCIITSESGYGCQNPVWTQTRSKGNGNWGQSSAYKFLGFIKNPAIGADDDPYPKPTRVLKEGMNGEDVKWMQWKLKKLAYLPDNVDGWFGVHTLGALLVFQLKNGLEVDGICGPATRAMLEKI